jgi:colicin import membrane protein
LSTATLRLDDWYQARDERERQDIHRRLVASVVGHIVVFVLLVGLPSFRTPSPLPAVVSVDLVAAVPRATPAAPKPAPQAPKPPPKPAAVPPPPPEQKTKVLPREAPKARAKPVPKKSPKPPPLDYEDALSSLRDELGEPAPSAEQAIDREPAPATGGRGRVDPELAAWQIAVQRALARSWVTPVEYRDSELRTLLYVTVMADGSVLGEPIVRRSSGDPHFDDNAVRAVLQASPLPPPPSAGDWPFEFDPTD